LELLHTEVPLGRVVFWLDVARRHTFHGLGFPAPGDALRVAHVLQAEDGEAHEDDVLQEQNANANDNVDVGRFEAVEVQEALPDGNPDIWVHVK
jgi:hypothetical protein